MGNIVQLRARLNNCGTAYTPPRAVSRLVEPVHGSALPIPRAKPLRGRMPEGRSAIPRRSDAGTSSKRRNIRPAPWLPANGGTAIAFRHTRATPWHPRASCWPTSGPRHPRSFRVIPRYRPRAWGAWQSIGASRGRTSAARCRPRTQTCRPLRDRRLPSGGGREGRIGRSLLPSPQLHRLARFAAGALPAVDDDTTVVMRSRGELAAA